MRGPPLWRIVLSLSPQAVRRRRRSAKPARPAPKKRPHPKPADREAKVVSKVIPKYPAAALRGGDAGMVVVRVQVDSTGAPGSASIVKRSGSRDLDRAALDAIRKWRFSPAMHDGKPVAATLDVPVQFTQSEQ